MKNKYFITTLKYDRTESGSLRRIVTTQSFFCREIKVKVFPNPKFWKRPNLKFCKK